MKYHIVFKIQEKDYYSQGETFEGHSAISAITAFNNKHPNAIFLAMYSLDTVSILLKAQLDEAESDKIDKENNI